MSYGKLAHCTDRHLWKEHADVPGSEHTVAAAALVRDSWNKDATKLLAAFPQPEREAKNE